MYLIVNEDKQVTLLSYEELDTVLSCLLADVECQIGDDETLDLITHIIDKIRDVM